MKLKIITTEYNYSNPNNIINNTNTRIIDGALTAWNYYKSECEQNYTCSTGYRHTYYMVIHDDSVYVPCNNPHKLNINDTELYAHKMMCAQIALKQHRDALPIGERTCCSLRLRKSLYNKACAALNKKVQ